MSSLLKTLNKNDNEKFNPDIANLYNKATETRNTIKYEHTNQGYKSITTEKLPNTVTSQDDFKIAYNKLNETDNTMILKKISELENDRLNEKKKLESQLDHSKKLDELIKIKRKEIVETNYQASTHVELKTMQIKDTDNMKKQKEKLNNIVSSINEIFNN